MGLLPLSNVPGVFCVSSLMMAQHTEELVYVRYEGWAQTLVVLRIDG